MAKRASRAVSVSQLISKKRTLLAFEGKWKRSFGRPERTGSWLVYGNSGHGKTSFALQLCKYMTRFGRVAYNSMEEGDSESMKLAFIREGMMEVRRKLILLDNEPITELKERLRKHKAPTIVVIDSLQYSGMNYKQYKDLRDEFRNVLFIIISHAEGSKPAGRVAVQVLYDSFVKIHVEGFKAFITSRYGGGEEFVISEQQAEKYHVDKI